MSEIVPKKCKDCRKLDTQRLQIKGAGFCKAKRHLRSLERRADTCRDFDDRSLPEGKGKPANAPRT